MSSEARGELDVRGREVLLEPLAYLLPMLDHTEDAIIALDKERRIAAWNKGAERMYGWSADEMLGRHPPSFLHLDLGDERLAEVRRELDRLGRWRGEASVERKDGSFVWIDALTVAVRGRDGTITGYLGIHRDITERKRAEQALREARQRTESILESIGDAFFAADRDWRYTYLNQRAVAHAAAALGRDVSAEELLGQSCWETFPEWVGTPFYEASHDALREQRAMELEIYVERIAGWFEARLYPSDTGVSTYLRDITERKRDEDQLRYHASLLDNMEEGLIATDADDFRITAWNRGAERLYGYSAEEVLGRPAREVATFPGDQARLKLEGELLDTGRTGIELTAARKDGSPVDVELIATAVKDEQGKTSGYLGIHRDISRRKRGQEQLRLSQRELEQRVRQQAAVAELGLAALRTVDLRSVMDSAALLVASTLEVEYASVNELLADRERLLVSAGAGWSAGVVGTATLPAGRSSPAGYALLTRQPVIVDDMTAETRFEVPALLRKHDVMSEIIVVIGLVGDPFGTLTALSKRRRTFSVHDLSFMQSVANVLATAVERFTLDERLEVARKAERARISRELHDDALRELTKALGIALVARSNSSEPQDEQRWAALTLTLRLLGQELRSAIYDLRLGIHEDRAFADLLDELVALQSELAVSPTGRAARAGGAPRRLARPSRHRAAEDRPRGGHERAPALGRHDDPRRRRRIDGRAPAPHRQRRRSMARSRGCDLQPHRNGDHGYARASRRARRGAPDRSGTRRRHQGVAGASADRMKAMSAGHRLPINRQRLDGFATVQIRVDWS